MLHRSCAMPLFLCRDCVPCSAICERTQRQCFGGAYCVFALCAAFDVIGSLIWGNSLTHGVDLVVGSFYFVLDNQLTSCITSQLTISIYLAFVSCRSVSGRAWRHAPIRFELREGEIGVISLPELAVASSSGSGTGDAILHETEENAGRAAAPPREGSHDVSAATQHLPSIFAEVLISHDEISNAELSSWHFQIRLRLLKFRMRHRAKCRVFAIPCHNNGSVVRPLLKIQILRPLHRLADNYPLSYAVSVALLFSFSVASAVLLARGVLSFSGAFTLPVILTITTCIAFVGLLSNKLNNIDSVAAKHVASSFRFFYCVLLMICWISLHFRDAYVARTTFWRLTTLVLAKFEYFLCCLLDCSPRLSAVVQFLISVMI